MKKVCQNNWNNDCKFTYTILFTRFTLLPKIHQSLFNFLETNDILKSHSRTRLHNCLYYHLAHFFVQTSEYLLLFLFCDATRSIYHRSSWLRLLRQRLRRLRAILLSYCCSGARCALHLIDWSSILLPTTYCYVRKRLIITTNVCLSHAIFHLFFQCLNELWIILSLSLYLYKLFTTGHIKLCCVLTSSLSEKFSGIINQLLNKTNK